MASGKNSEKSTTGAAHDRSTTYGRNGADQRSVQIESGYAVGDPARHERLDGASQDGWQAGGR